MISPFESEGSAASTRFMLGRTYATPAVISEVPSAEINDALRRHQSGDWGDVKEEDWKANDQALTDGTRLLSSYRSSAGLKFWIITEADRSTTTVLFPEEY